MKRVLLVIVMLVMALLKANAAHLMPATGRVVDSEGQGIEYATVVLLKDGAQKAGMATDADGRFKLDVPAGEYTLSIQYLGYDPVVRTIRVEQSNDLGDISLKSSATEIEGVVVKAQLIRREADRFVVDVANAPAAAGKDGIELLERAPGVWVEEEKISINGKSGSKVYINDRELRMEPAQMINYLKSLRAEEIQRIEVIPTSGADYDANTTSGIIKITLKKRRENGLDGSLSMRTTQCGIRHEYTPSGNINIHSGRLDVMASAWGDFDKSKTQTQESTRYTTSDANLKARSNIADRDKDYGASAGAIYQINDRHSAGAELSFWHSDKPSLNHSNTDFFNNNLLTETQSRFDTSDKQNNITATVNYIWKIDTLGSTIKLLADYTHRASDKYNDNFSRITTPTSVVDSTYRDQSTARYNITTVTAALEKNFSDRWSLKAGAKYTYNDMRNAALYEYQNAEAWLRNDNQSFTLNYQEQIAAAYGIASAKFGRLSAVVGLRGEYTHTSGKGGEIEQDYFSLFPNANLSYSLSKKGDYLLVAQYARTIDRPNFWALNPQRFQISDYTYQTGNPNLDPAYKHDVSLTLVLKYKYTITAGMTLETDEIQQTMRADADDPNRLQLAWVNFDNVKSYYLSANLPFQITKWWQANANLTYLRCGQRVEQHGESKYYNFFFANLSTTVILPAKFYIDLSYRYQSRVDLGNVWVEPSHALHASLKKKFGDRFTASFTVRNLTDQNQTVGATGDGFTRRVKMIQPWSSRTYQIGLVYNFKSGKAFNRKTIEAGSAEEKSRL